jgi:GNAT superfamily N-acetyltransferase
MLSINQIKSPKEISAAQELMWEYLLWFFALVPGSENAPTFQGWESEIASLPGIYVPPMGRLLLATYNEQPAGCVALKYVTDQIGELKRMYVSPHFRGKKIGGHLGKTLLDEARTTGYKKIVLDSHISMTHAHKIYEELGFMKVSAPPDFPQELIPIVVFMERDL